jgi:hypothetical protein
MTNATNTTINTVVKVEAGNVEDFLAYVEKMNKVARKLGLEEFKVEKLYDLCLNKQVVKNARKILTVETYMVYEVVGQNPVISGYEFIARLDFEAGKPNPTINAVPGKEVPAEFFTAKSFCEHCNSQRSRKSVHIVRNTETGHFMQVGSSCLKDFLGHGDIADTMRFLGLYGKCDDMGFDRQNGSVNPWLVAVDKDVMLDDLVKLIDTFGYVSRKMANEREISATGSLFAFGYLYLIGMVGRIELTDLDRKVLETITTETTEEQKARIEEVKAAISKIEKPKNSYEANLKNLMASDYWMVKDGGMVASMFYYAKQLAERANTETKQPESDFIGSVTDRLTLTLNIIDVKAVDSMWGISNLHVCADENGNRVTFFSAKTLGERNETKTFVGTVKEHRTFLNVKQTVLTRVKVK